MTLPQRTIRKIHSIKETLESQAEWKYAAALQQQMAVHNLLARFTQEYDEAASLLSARQVNGVSGIELHEWNLWLESLTNKIDVQRHLCKQADAYVEECKEILMQRHQDKQIWKKLQERSAAEIELTFRKQEQLEMDELGGRNRKPV